MPRHPEEHDRGLVYDLTTLLRRRRVLGLFAGAGMASLVGACQSDADEPAATAPGQPAASNAGGSPAGVGASCQKIPRETAGPFPGDGSNGPNILARSGIVRSDIRSSFGGASGVASGVPLTVNLTVVDTANGCAPLAGAAVYVWQCDADARYSMYSQGATEENYLRGVQAADGRGALTFQSIFPAAYQGRWPHLHFEVFRRLADATSAGGKLATSQLALPEAPCRAVYATGAYRASAAVFTRTSLGSDSVFRDGYASQLAAVTGGVAEGFTATLTVAV